LADLLISVAVYEFTRVLVDHDIVTESIHITRGLAVGSAEATSELVCIVLPLLRQVLQRVLGPPPRLELVVHVDKFSPLSLGAAETGR
jgi:hypothetical protein